MDEDFQQRLINASYGISYGLYKDVQKEKGHIEKELKICFTRFVNVKGLFLELYFRYLKQIVIFIDEPTLKRGIFWAQVRKSVDSPPGISGG